MVPNPSGRGRVTLAGGGTGEGTTKIPRGPWGGPTHWDGSIPNHAPLSPPSRCPFAVPVPVRDRTVPFWDDLTPNWVCSIPTPPLCTPSCYPLTVPSCLLSVPGLWRGHQGPGPRDKTGGAPPKLCHHQCHQCLSSLSPVSPVPPACPRSAENEKQCPHPMAGLSPPVVPTSSRLSPPRL